MRVAKEHWLKNSTIAHRGLHNDELAENSMSAFLFAMEKGYPIEIDIHITKDGKVVIFHDHDTKRVCGEDLCIEESTLQQLSSLKLCGTNDGIPLLEDLLAVATTPLLIELKNHSYDVGNLESATMKILQGFGGEFAVQSFNPFSMMWFEKNAPHILRGQLASYFSMTSKIRNHMLKSLYFNKKVKPDFISYDERFLPNKYVDKYTKKHPEVATIAWTVHSEERATQLADTASSIIFEGWLPKSKY